MKEKKLGKLTPLGIVQIIVYYLVTMVFYGLTAAACLSSAC